MDGPRGRAAAGLLTRFRDVVPKGRVELVLRLHDFGEEPGLTFFVKRRVSAEAATCGDIRSEKRVSEKLRRSRRAGAHRM